MATLTLLGTIQNVDPRLVDAAQALGAPGWKAHLTITLPLCMRGLLAAFLFAFTFSISAFVIPMILGKGRVLFISNLIYNRFSEIANYPSGAAISIVLFVGRASDRLCDVAPREQAVDLMSGRLDRRRLPAARPGDDRHDRLLPADAHRRDRGDGVRRARLSRASAAAVASRSAGFDSSSPTTISCAGSAPACSSRWPRSQCRSRSASQPPSPSTARAFPARRRWSRSSCRRSSCRRSSPVSPCCCSCPRWGWSTVSPACCAATSSSPCLIPSGRRLAGLAGIDRSLTEAALVLGATERQAFWDVTFPLARTGIVSGAIFAFAVSMDDVAVSIMLTDANTYTLPVALISSMRANFDLSIAAASVMLMLVTLVLILILDKFVGLNRVIGQGVFR